MEYSEVIDNIKQVAKEVLPQGSTLYLYGSRARGDYHADSDWDILILLDQPKVTNDDFKKFGYPLVDLGWTLDQTISPIMYTFSDWEKRHFTPFYKNIENEGIEIWH